MMLKFSNDDKELHLYSVLTVIEANIFSEHAKTQLKPTDTTPETDTNNRKFKMAKMTQMIDTFQNMLLFQDYAISIEKFTTLKVIKTTLYFG